MSTKRPSSTKLRRQVFEAYKWVDKLTGRTMLTCYLCNGPLDPARDAWHADHVIRRVLSGDDSVANLRPTHERCHRVDKTPKDIKDNSKGKRVRDKHFGIAKKVGGFRKKPEGYKFDWASKRYVKVDQ